MQFMNIFRAFIVEHYKRCVIFAKSIIYESERKK